MSSVKQQTPSDSSRCPFCGHDNSCAVSSDTPCWCFTTPVPKALLALLPDEQRRKSCVCFACVQAFNENPQAFSKAQTKE